MQTEYSETTGSLARKSECAPRTIVEYCDADLLDYIWLPSGMRLLRRGQEQKGRDIRRQRIANRGRRPAANT